MSIAIVVLGGVLIAYLARLLLRIVPWRLVALLVFVLIGVIALAYHNVDLNAVIAGLVPTWEATP